MLLKKHPKRTRKEQIDDIQYRIVEIETLIDEYYKKENHLRVTELQKYLDINKALYKILTGRDYDLEMELSGLH